MTDEQLQQAAKEVSGELESLSKSEESLTKQEMKRKRLLSLKLQVLKGVEEAKEMKDSRDEIYNAMCYEILLTWGERHPVWARFIMTSIRWYPL